MRAAPIVIVVVISALCSIPGRARAASFDCDKAATDVERLVCEFPELSRLDSEMADRYFAKRAALAEDARQALTLEQRAFLKRRAECRPGTTTAATTVREVVAVRDCLQDVYDARIRELKSSGVPGAVAQSQPADRGALPPPVLAALPSAAAVSSAKTAAGRGERCPQLSSFSFELVEGATVRLGNNEGNFSDEAPRHDVAIDRFCVMTSRLSSAHVQALLRLLGEVKLPTRLGYDSDLQQRLIGLGFLAGEADGDVGPQTREAIRRFQQARSLPVTGEFDSATIESLSSGSEVSLSDLVEEAKFSYTEASALLRLVSERTGLRLRLLREPEWEYLANRTPARVADLYEDWELTSSIYAPYPYVATDGRERADRLDAFRSIRGGALERFGGEGDQYASLRGFAAPGTRYQFRLATSPVK